MYSKVKNVLVSSNYYMKYRLLHGIQIPFSLATLDVHTATV